MTNYARINQQLTQAIRPSRRPVAIAFRDSAPAGVPAFTGSLPSGCSFWKLAAEGRTFHTVAADHYNCPIGSYTHNIPLPPERESELMQTLSLMAEIGYIRMEEVGAIPRVAQTPAVVALAQALGIDPIVVVIALIARSAGARNRSAKRLARAILGKAADSTVEAALNEVGLS